MTGVNFSQTAIVKQQDQQDYGGNIFEVGFAYIKANLIKASIRQEDPSA
jgi:hypothetical protein